MSASLAVGCGDPPGYANDRSRQEPVRRRGPTADRRCAHRMLGPLVGIPDTREADDPRHRPGWSSFDEVRASPGLSAADCPGGGPDRERSTCVTTVDRPRRWAMPMDQP